MRNQDPALTADELRSLRCLAGMMIPASTAHGVPGADDDTIFADIVDNLGRDAAPVKQGLQHLHALAGSRFADRDPAQRQAAVAALQDAGGAPLMALISVVAQCYYRDRRVMSSLGIEVRPPFPKGYEVAQGDWSLLDPVRARAAFYRRTP
jgi:hypothetical protein